MPCLMPELTFNGFLIDAQGILRAASWLGIPWLEHGFETKASTGLADGFAVASMRQVHGATVKEVPRTGGFCGEGDALVTAHRGVLLAVRTADCVPVLLADPQTRTVAAVHAGWRGVVAEVIPHTVDCLRRTYGAKPESLLAAVGPCIRQAAFEVGPEVAVQFQRLFRQRQDPGQRDHVDLAAACRTQLAACGVSPARVEDCGECTFSQPVRYHSFRRDREAAGRMQAFIGLRE